MKNMKCVRKLHCHLHHGHAQPERSFFYMIMMNPENNCQELISLIKKEKKKKRVFCSVRVLYNVFQLLIISQMRIILKQIQRNCLDTYRLEEKSIPPNFLCIYIYIIK